jgi:hypothetical protein
MRIAFAGQIVLGRDEIGPLEIPVVDFLSVDELHEVDGALALKLHRIDLRLFEEDIGIGLDFVALHDVLAVDWPDALDNALHVHEAAGGLVDLIEGDLSLRLDGRVDLDRNGNEGQSEMPLSVASGILGHTHTLQLGLGCR